MRQRAIGFQLGMRGDLAISTATARAFKQIFPDAHLTLGMGPQYADMVDLFRDHSSYDAVHVYDSYDDWPNQVDQAYLSEASYDLVFNGKPPLRHDWFVHGHQTVEVARVHGLRVTDCSLSLTKWFDVERRSKCVAFAPFAGFYAPDNRKRLSVASAQSIVDFLLAKGYSVLQLGGPDEPYLNGTIFPKTSYFDSVRAMLGCDLLIHTDTGLGWVASAYRHPQLGLYGYWYHGASHIHNIQPVNPNARYLDAMTVAEIPLDSIYQLCQDMLA